MRPWLYVLLFVAGTAMTWGMYVPSIHKSAGPLHSNLRAFLLVGLAYFLVAVLIPAFLIFVVGWDPTARGGDPEWNSRGIRWGLWAGTLGALGALSVIFAVVSAPGGLGPLIVPPLVFCFAPIVNTIATLVYFHPPKGGVLPDWRFFLGLAMAIGGAALVMIYKPTDKRIDAKPPAAVSPQDAAQAGIPAPESAGS